MWLLSEDDVRRSVEMPAAIEAVRQAFGSLSAGRAEVPLRHSLRGDGGDVLLMPGRLDGPLRIGAKTVSVFPDNPERGLEPVNAAVQLLDPATGRIRALIAGNHLTALRTGAASGVATDLLAREDASVLALFGAGTQARSQLQAVSCVRELREVRVVAGSASSAQAFAREHGSNDSAGSDGHGTVDYPVRAVADPADALRDADIVVAATDSSTPVFAGPDVEAGAHVNGIGSYTPAMQEVDAELINRAIVVVDERGAALEEAGDLIVPIRRGEFSPDGIHAEIGEIVNGSESGRTRPDEVTFFKSVGNVVQDLAVASLAARVARERGLGTRLPW